MNTKGESNSGAIHLILAGSQGDGNLADGACSTGKVRVRVTPLQHDRPLTCKRCLRLKANADTAAADTGSIDALLETIEQAITQEVATGRMDADEAQGLRETAPEAAREAAQVQVDEATASDTEAAEEAAERDALDNTAAEVLVNGDITAEQHNAAGAAAAPAPAQRARVNQKALVLAHLDAHRGISFTPHQISKAVTPAGSKALGLRDVCARLAAAGEIEAVAGTKSATYRLPLDAQYAAGQPADDTEA